MFRVTSWNDQGCLRINYWNAALPPICHEEILAEIGRDLWKDESHGITWSGCFPYYALCDVESQCLPKTWPLVTRSSSFCQQRKWSSLVRAGRISEELAVLLVLDHQENHGLVCLLAGHTNHKELVPTVTRRHNVKSAFLQILPYLMHS